MTVTNDDGFLINHIQAKAAQILQWASNNPQHVVQQVSCKIADDILDLWKQ